jgi:hypothetical protein
MQVVNEYPNVFFSEELPGMPSNLDIEFIIELLPGTAPMYKNPYRMSTPQLRELKDHIQELEGKGISVLAQRHGEPLSFLSLRKMAHRGCVLTIMLSTKSP